MVPLSSLAAATARRTAGRAAGTAACAAAALLLGSCSRSDRQPVYPVRGQVLVGERPAARAFVVLHPVGHNSPAALRPYGHADEGGAFSLTTYDPGDGAPAGDYQVTIVWLASAAPNADAPDRLQGRYRDPQTTPLKATVLKQPTQLEPFRLSP